MKKQKGVTLLELIVTMVIIGLMAVFAVPSISAFMSKAKVRAATIELQGVLMDSKSKSVCKCMIDPDQPLSDPGNPLSPPNYVPISYRVTLNPNKTYFQTFTTEKDAKSGREDRWTQDGPIHVPPNGVSVATSSNVVQFWSDGTVIQQVTITLKNSKAGRTLTITPPGKIENKIL
jgi:prepilin-type N-terminal cleavage/methylation domain-containing protein